MCDTPIPRAVADDDSDSASSPEIEIPISRLLTSLSPVFALSKSRNISTKKHTALQEGKMAQGKSRSKPAGSRSITHQKAGVVSEQYGMMIRIVEHRPSDDEDDDEDEDENEKDAVEIEVEVEGATSVVADNDNNDTESMASLDLSV